MTKFKALTKLAAKVQTDQHSDHLSCTRAGIPAHLTDDFTLAFEGSLDAAEKLHDALLPGWDWQIYSDGVTVHNEDCAYTVCGEAKKKTAACTWLLAILRVLIAYPEAKT